MVEVSMIFKIKIYGCLFLGIVTICSVLLIEQYVQSGSGILKKENWQMNTPQKGVARVDGDGLSLSSFDADKMSVSGRRFSPWEGFLLCNYPLISGVWMLCRGRNPGIGRGWFCFSMRGNLPGTRFPMWRLCWKGPMSGKIIRRCLKYSPGQRN